MSTFTNKGQFILVSHKQVTGFSTVVTSTYCLKSSGRGYGFVMRQAMQ